MQLTRGCLKRPTVLLGLTLVSPGKGSCRTKKKVHICSTVPWFFSSKTSSWYSPSSGNSALKTSWSPSRLALSWFFFGGSCVFFLWSSPISGPPMTGTWTSMELLDVGSTTVGTAGLLSLSLPIPKFVQILSGRYGRGTGGYCRLFDERKCSLRTRPFWVRQHRK